MYLKYGVEHVPYLSVYFLSCINIANSDTGILYFSLSEIKH